MTGSGIIDLSGIGVRLWRHPGDHYVILTEIADET